MDRIKKKLPHYIVFLLKLYAIGLCYFALMRLSLILCATDSKTELFRFLTIKSFFIGFQFDTATLMYAFFLPLLLLFVQSLVKIHNRIIPWIVSMYFCLLVPVFVVITFADIPYFAFFKNRFSEIALQWLGSPKVVAEMIISNPFHAVFLILALIATSFGCYAMFRYCKKQLILHNWSEEHNRFGRLYSIVAFVLLFVFYFTGFRGTLSHPIKVFDAVYCKDPILNQVGLNPVFTLLKSYTSKVHLMDNELALKQTQILLKINQEKNATSPIARTVTSSGSMSKYNIVLVLMESMSANYMTTFGNPHHLTPTLDSLAHHSWFFKNAFSAGIHTNNGVFSSLYSFPALKRIRPMSTVPVRSYSGLPAILKKNGYHNMFFTTHEASFDNLSVFIPANNFDALYAAENYPKDKIIGPYGVADDYLFSYAVNKINTLPKRKPFLATILTTSNHDPYILPDYFKSSLTEKDLRGVQYADWSIGMFLKEAKKQAWFDSTIFVFVADHGLVVGDNPYDLRLSYQHIPIIFYAPTILGTPKTIDNFMGQIDIFPTLMGILHTGYTNNTLGVDVLHQKRECMYFSADDKIGCINENWLYVYRFGGGESLYQYKTGNQTDFAKTQKKDFDFLRNYALSQIQTAEYMYTLNKTR